MPLRRAERINVIRVEAPKRNHTLPLQTQNERRKEKHVYFFWGFFAFCVTGTEKMGTVCNFPGAMLTLQFYQRDSTMLTFSL